MTIPIEQRIISKGTVINGPDGEFYEVIKDLPFTAPKSAEYLLAGGGAPYPGTNPRGPFIPPWAAMALRRAFGVEVPTGIEKLYESTSFNADYSPGQD